LVRFSVPPLIVVAPLTVLAPDIVTEPVKVLSSVIAPMVRPVAVVTLFVGVPVKSASLPLVKAVPPQLAAVDVSHVPLVVPVQVDVTAFAEETTPRAESSPTIAAEAWRRGLRRFAEVETDLEGRFFMK
jgi:hypothetical protein